MLSIQCPEVATMKQIFRDIEDFLRLFAVVPPLPPPSFLVLAAEGVEGKTNEAANQKGFLPSAPLPRQSTPHFPFDPPFNRALWTALSLISLFFPSLCFRRAQRAIRFRHAERRRERAQIPQHLEPEGEPLPPQPLFFLYILDRRIAQSIRIT